jgi:hypothetical protein
MCCGSRSHGMPAPGDSCFAQGGCLELIFSWSLLDEELLLTCRRLYVLEASLS